MLDAPTSGPVCQTPSPVVVYFQCECTRSCHEKFHAVLDEQTIGYPTAGWIPLTLGGAQTCCLLGSRCEVHCNTIDKVDGTWCAFPKGTLPILVCVNFYWCSTKFCISTSHGLKIIHSGVSLPQQQRCCGQGNQVPYNLWQCFPRCGCKRLQERCKALNREGQIPSVVGYVEQQPNQTPKICSLLFL